MTIYTSTPNDWQLQDAYVLTGEIPDYTLYTHFEPDTTVPVTDVAAHPADYVTMTGIMDALEKAPETHAAPRARYPRWAVTSVAVGGLMAVLGIGLANPIAQAVWSLIHG